MLYKTVHIYFLHTNLILLTECLMVTVRLVQNHIDVFSLHSTCRLTLILASPSLFCR
jgi:hypothetical protein